ncbi:MAG: hypothetical protein WC666_03885 [Candidatus Paceibacterota bacterium]|jgi:hypothetical protein
MNEPYQIQTNEGVSTSTKQDTIITNQATLNTLITTLNTLVASQSGIMDAIHELASRMAVLGAAQGSVADLRVTPLSLPTLAAVTTVATLTNQTNIGGFAATGQVRATQNNLAIQSNINNIA